MDVDKCVTVIIWIWWLKPALSSAELYHTEHQRDRTRSKTESAIMWLTASRIKRMVFRLKLMGCYFLFPSGSCGCLVFLILMFVDSDSTLDSDITRDAHACSRVAPLKARIFSPLKHQSVSLIQRTLRGFPSRLMRGATGNPAQNLGGGDEQQQSDTGV